MYQHFHKHSTVNYSCALLIAWLVVFAVVALISGVCVQYSVWVVLNKHIAMLPAAVIGILGGEVTVPLAIVLAILRATKVI